MSKRQQKLFPTSAKVFPTMHQFESDLVNHFYDEKFIEEQSIAEEYFKSQKRIPKSVDFGVDSDEEFKAELENAVKQYKKNNKENELVGKESNFYNKREKFVKETDEYLNTLDNISSNFGQEKSKYNNGNATTDVQELINYFFLCNKDKSEKPTNKSYIDYEKQGAIPKRKFTGGEYSERGRNQCETKNAKINKKSKNNKSKNQLNVQEVLPVNSQQGTKNNFIEYNFTKKSNSDDIIVKISEEYASKPFFYIVPENPSPNFFLSRGSYYVIPKTPSSPSEDRIIFHPENETECYPKMKFNEILNGEQHKVKQHGQVDMNNLGKEVFRKMDSHLNIGPVDVKLNDSDNNLESKYDLNKSFNKIFLNSNSSNGFQEERPEADSGLLIKTETENLNSDEEMTLNERIILQKLDKALQTLLSEFPNLDQDSAEVIVNKYFLDEDGLRNYIASTHLKQKIEHQFERMALALPENNWNELRDKCNEFQGDEELVENYIREAQKANKIRQKLIDVQFLFPDADPNFLNQEIEKLKDDDESFNILINQFLEMKDYPKISEDPLSAERRKLWRIYVDNFNVKNYILKVSNPENFAGPAGDNNKTDQELIVKFLESRYPSRSRSLLIQAFEFNNRNLTKTCNYLNEPQLIRLSKSSFRNEAFSEAFLEEICYIDHKEEIDKYLKDLKERKEIETEEARLNNSFLFCPLCSEDELIASDAICCFEGHLFCKNCIQRLIFIKMSEGVFKFACPSESCDTFFSYKTLREILPENILSNIISKQQAEEINSARVDGLEFCPYCEFAYIPNPEDKIFKCQNSACLVETCRLCHEKNHIPLRCEEIERPADVEARKKIEESMTLELVRICPTCQKKFVKIDGCNKMACVCGTIVCYICRKKVTGYDHFNQAGGKCPLYSNNAELHTTEVIRAGIRTRERILQSNQDIRILYDPTINKQE